MPDRTAGRKEEVVRRIALVILSAVLLLVIGCGGRDVVGGLTKDRAVQLSLLLGRAGVTAEAVERTTRGTTSTFALRVSSADFERAAAILAKLDALTSDQQTVEELTRQEGFVPNPAQLIQLRVDRALAIDAEHVLRALASVLDARVVVRTSVAEGGRSGRNIQAAAVLVMAPEGGESRPSEADVQELLQRAVPGLTPATTAIRLVDLELLSSASGRIGYGRRTGGEPVPLEGIWPYSFETPKEQRVMALRQIALTMILAATLAGVVGTYIGWLGARRSRRSR
ncbi:MAG: hypothetical protein KDD44_00415 [Bdellovibrionales bacterium]|nr:hypothetical protein [Bdellovibrionales bacterium]